MPNTQPGAMALTNWNWLNRQRFASRDRGLSITVRRS